MCAYAHVFQKLQGCVLIGACALIRTNTVFCKNKQTMAFKRKIILSVFSVIMLDEAHERTLNTDIIMGLVRKVRHSQMSHVMRNLGFCLCENKAADQLCSNCIADQGLCFRYTDSTIPLLLITNFKPLACFCDCTSRFVFDLVGNPNDQFSPVVAQIVSFGTVSSEIFVRTYL